jgi:dTDP-4-dehydrorhamnose reductase
VSNSLWDMHPGASKNLELWGGIECTVNRVGEHYFDQLNRTGHLSRPEDLERFAPLGISAIRYPVLWECTAPDKGDHGDWNWPDSQLHRFPELGITPIVGLVHHGSGPRYTNLLDPDFPRLLADYAGAVAKHYPWINYYTPINEPLTTARFSGLYGLWYPHARDPQSFMRALLHQCRAVVLAMQAIRAINPAAQLIQTEDLGKTHSTPRMAYQAQHENERRWLGFDLLCGKVNRSHPLWDYLRYLQVPEDELLWFLDHPCPPDMMGFNYYLTSERFLDERTGLYPDFPTIQGGNGRDQYVDVEAVRVRAEGLSGPLHLLREAWDRFGLPVALTEVHNGSSREEQMRWFVEVWQAAHDARAQGVDIRAVTAWALLGSYDWNSMVTRHSGHYEVGVFDLRSGEPRPTAMAHLLKELSQGDAPGHPILSAPGWWRRPDRLVYGVRNTEPEERTGLQLWQHGPARTPIPLLIIGTTGTLSRAFALLCDIRGLPYVAVSRREMDITRAATIERILDQIRPWAVINTAGYVRVDDAESERDECYQTNAEGPALLAAACAGRGIRLVTFSSDLVFDGAKLTPYIEEDPARPLGVYGHSKAEAESRVLSVMPSALVVRTSAFFGPWDEHNFAAAVLRALYQGERFAAASDIIISPTYVPDLVNITLDLLIDGEAGLWHLANQGSLSWAEFARRTATSADLDSSLIVESPGETLGFIAPRPPYSALGSSRGLLLPDIDFAIHRFIGERRAA